MDHPQLKPPRAQINWLPSRLFADYFWFVLKNVVGWTLILLAWPVGLLVPGPGGLPIFLIGFALVTFPGKRSLTARVLKGVPLDLRHRRFTWLTLVAAMSLPVIVFWLFSLKRHPSTAWLAEHNWQSAAAYVAAAVASWFLAKGGLLLLNWVIRKIPVVRRKIRPWLRRNGFDLLPPRRRKRLGHYPGEKPKPDEEILEIHERHHRRLRDIWASAKPYAKRSVGLIFAGVVFGWLTIRITQHWHEIRPSINQISPLDAVVATLMFSMFLVAFRMITWWRILAGLGHPLPFRPALRIWTSSELARYVGSGVSQMLSRVYLCKPYGIPTGTTSASQLLELVLFLLANILVGVGCMAFLGIKIEGKALTWFYVACALIPLLLAVLHPKIFYPLLNAILRMLHKTECDTHLPARTVFSLLLFNVVGLFFQGWSIWLLTSEPLGLKPQHWWVVTGAYCLAWTAGFIAIWANAGIGVREPVFVLAAAIALPASVRAELAQPKGLLMFLAILLRLWATLGELLLALVAYFLDYRGALGTPDATGLTPSARQSAHPPNPTA
jgi:hypothetical protein